MIVEEEALLQATGYADRGWLERWLRANRVKYFRGKDDRLFTTIGLLEASKLDKDPAGGSRRPISFVHGQTS